MSLMDNCFMLCCLYMNINTLFTCSHMDRVKRIWYLSPMRAANVQASLRIRAVSPEPSLLAHTSSESRGTFRQKARSLAPLNGWACAVKICHDGMLEDTNSLDGAHIIFCSCFCESNVKHLRSLYFFVIVTVRLNAIRKLLLIILSKVLSFKPSHEIM